MFLSQNKFFHSNQSDKRLPNQLNHENFLILFEKMGFKPKEDASSFDLNSPCNRSLYFESTDSILFPPCTDYPTDDLMPGINDHLQISMSINKAILSGKKWVLFPLFERGTVFFKSRNSWVLLVYQLANQEIHVLDPTGPKRAALYKHNFTALNQALQNISPNFKIEDERCWYLNIQELNDHSSSGYWVAYMIKLLVKYDSLADLRNEVTKPTIKIKSVIEELSGLFSIESTPSVNLNDDSEHHRVYHFADAQTQVANKNDNPIIGSNRDGLPTYQVIFNEDSDYLSFKKQPFTQTQRTTDQICSFLSSGIEIPSNLRTRISMPEQQGCHFIFDFYAMLIMSGSIAIVIFSLYLSGVVPFLSFTAAMSLLAFGSALFLSGVFGKYSCLEAPQSPVSETHSWSPSSG